VRPSGSAGASAKKSVWRGVDPIKLVKLVTCER
jgi:hypothetical protein